MEEKDLLGQTELLPGGWSGNQVVSGLVADLEGEGTTEQPSPHVPGEDAGDLTNGVGVEGQLVNGLPGVVRGFRLRNCDTESNLDGMKATADFLGRQLGASEVSGHRPTFTREGEEGWSDLMLTAKTKIRKVGIAPGAEIRGEKHTGDMMNFLKFAHLANTLHIFSDLCNTIVEEGLQTPFLGVKNTDGALTVREHDSGYWLLLKVLKGCDDSQDKSRLHSEGRKFSTRYSEAV